MPTKLKSRTTIRPSPRNAKAPVARRLPANRPPTHPGEILLEEFLRPLGISQSSFAVRLGISFPRLNEVVRRRRSVTPDTALRLARVLGVSAGLATGLGSVACRARQEGAGDCNSRAAPSRKLIWHRAIGGVSVIARVLWPLSR
jgi:addiction module HigA family antidote